MPYLFLIIVVSAASILTSFVCSLTEACIYAISMSHIETLQRQGDPRGEILARIRARIDDAIAAILIVNTTANTAGAAIAGGLVRQHYGDTWLGVFTAAFTLTVLFVAEIVPKSLGVRFAPVLGPFLALPLKIVVWLLYPLIRLCVLVTRTWGCDAHAGHGTEEDIISMAHLVLRGGEIHRQEAEWVANALLLNDTTTFELMTPSPVVLRVPADMKIRDTRIDADLWRYSRIPVTDPERHDEIVGVVTRRKVFAALARDEFDKNMGDLMDSAESVAEALPGNELLEQFLTKRRHLFCVVDADGHFTGVVTLEDVVEYLLGRQIVDETDLHEDLQAVARKRKEALLDKRRGDGGRQAP